MHNNQVRKKEFEAKDKIESYITIINNFMDMLMEQEFHPYAQFEAFSDSTKITPNVDLKALLYTAQTLKNDLQNSQERKPKGKKDNFNIFHKSFFYPNAIINNNQLTEILKESTKNLNVSGKDIHSFLQKLKVSQKEKLN